MSRWMPAPIFSKRWYDFESGNGNSQNRLLPNSGLHAHQILLTKWKGVFKLFAETPGLVGLYISAAYSATMSTISTGLNSIATVIFKTIFPANETADAKSLIRKQRIFMVVLGYAIIFLAYTMIFLPDTLVSVSVTIVGGFACIIGIATNRLNSMMLAPIFFSSKGNRLGRKICRQNFFQWQFIFVEIFFWFDRFSTNWCNETTRSKWLLRHI